jgi:hypothetical protein
LYYYHRPLRHSLVRSEFYSAFAKYPYRFATLLIARVQSLILSNGCDILFVPSGQVVGRTMKRNGLTFHWNVSCYMFLKKARCVPTERCSSAYYFLPTKCSDGTQEHVETFGFYDHLPYLDGLAQWSSFKLRQCTSCLEAYRTPYKLERDK